MSRKQASGPVLHYSQAALGATAQTNPFEFLFQDNAGIQVIWTNGSSPNFAISIEANNQADTIPTASLVWTGVTITGSPVISGASGSVLISLSDFPWRRFRIVFTRTAGSADVAAWVTGKAK